MSKLPSGEPEAGELVLYRPTEKIHGLSAIVIERTGPGHYLIQIEHPDDIEEFDGADEMTKQWLMTDFQNFGHEGLPFETDRSNLLTALEIQLRNSNPN